MYNEEPPEFRHTRESGYPGLISAGRFNGMTDSVRHLDSRVRGNDESRREQEPFSCS